MEPSVNHAEPGDCETLNVLTSYIHEGNTVEYVRIGVLEDNATGDDGTVSFQLVQFSAEHKCKVLQANLSAKEIDVVIDGLQEAKKRMKAMNESTEES